MEYMVKRKRSNGGLIMIERYTRPEMGSIWTEENKFKAWLEVEILACEAWAELGDIPKEDVQKVRENASFDINRIYEIEQETRHDVVAFTRAVSETLGEERKWVHYGLTSTDVVDTALSYLLAQANDILLKDLENFVEILGNKAKEHKYTVMMGRTHGVHAEPTTFGLKLALWYDEMRRNVERFKQATNTVRVGKMSGAVGTFANIPPFIEEFVCDKLGLVAAPVSTQTLQRDRHAHYISTLALIATSIEKMAVEIRGLQKSETREVEEFFAKGQKGSSAMPHKRNPIGSENMTGLARVIRGHMVTAYENVPLWHERDISHSSAERIILPDATILLNYMLNRFGNIVKNLTVFPENMKRNMDRTYGLIFSQRVMLTLIDKGMAREEAYDIVQPKAMEAWETQVHFKELVKAEDRITAILSEEEIEECFDPAYHLSGVDTIFDRVGL
jgi:adenylosuccinate lyase